MQPDTVIKHHSACKKICVQAKAGGIANLLLNTPLACSRAQHVLYQQFGIYSSNTLYGMPYAIVIIKVELAQHEQATSNDRYFINRKGNLCVQCTCIL